MTRVPFSTRCIFLATLAFYVPATFTRSRTLAQSCSFTGIQTQTCTPETHQATTYFNIDAIYDSNANLAVDVREQKPANARNSFVNLSKGPWDIGGFEDGGFLSVWNRMPRAEFWVQGGERQEIRRRTSESEDILFEFGSLKWTSEEVVGIEGGEKSAWCEVSEWDIQDWGCKGGAQTVVAPRTRSMNCTFAC